MKIEFIGIGAARSGTTWIAKCLMEHPNIFFPYEKELNYFSKTRANNTKSEYEITGIEGYEKLFAKCPKNKIKGEYSTYYLSDSDSAKIIKKHFPNVKIIVSLREPVERAFSDYKNVKNVDLNEEDSFEKAFFRDGNELENYRERGMYYKHLKIYFQLFPRKNIHIIIYDDIKDNPSKVIKELYHFLEVDNNFIPDSLNKIINPQKSTRFKSIRYGIDFLRKLSHGLEKIKLGKIVSIIKRKTRLNKFFESINKINKKTTEMEKIDLELKANLGKLYLKDIEKLEELNGRQLNRWKK